MPHDHSHGHAGHVHAAPPPGGAFSAAFATGIALNIAFVIAETIGGLAAHSAALLADAGHNLSDVLSLALAWGAAWLGGRRSSTRFTYGYKGATIQAALLNAALLYAALGFILWETIDHLRHPAPVNGQTVMLLAGLGIVINGFTAWLFRHGQKSDVNVRGAYLHMLTDALVSAGVVLGGGLVMWTGWTWLDPIISFGILAMIAVSSWGLLRDTVRLGLQAVPEGIDLAAVRSFLLQQPDVLSVHDLHIWSLSSGDHDTALTAHLVRPGGADAAWLARLAKGLETEFHIHHSTVQVEDGPTPGGCASGCSTSDHPVEAAAAAASH
ncbi:cation diffusion facilitator family transporter [Hymenobacter sp. BT770]|uniref:cation diffusion facilitator family transporter n=1 Tax=Hymenobacter sp. BT770 TaxID=2886942 RepID=UPI001D0F6BE4|nr:cation diffusion facilitator family transporter [Hymenobacter sp. BT770]MCC3153398.1 cation diffusion facilitator family transporter [Hymenobacter sp. BT770]MDO3415520.1 cation diffusion facilitator family transporter [Hymenobacter sp. BT770]